MMNKVDMYMVPCAEISLDDKVLIYGAGKMGEYALRRLRENGRNNIVGIVDRNANNIINIFDGVKLYEPCVLQNLYADKYLIAVENSNVAFQMREDLIKAGIMEDSILYCTKEADVTTRTMSEINKFITRNFEKYKRRIFLFMLPEHGNTGDYLIGYSEFNFFKKYFNDYEVFGVTTTEWLCAKDLLINLMNIDDIVCINGGGFFGNLRGDDLIYKDIVESFPENIKIFMPNTLTYSQEPDDYNLDFINDIKWIKAQRKLHIFLREDRSYQILNKYIDNCSLAPDMALQMSYENKKPAKTDKVLLCLRKDCEKMFEKSEQLEKILSNNDIGFEYFDIFVDRFVSQEAGKGLLSYVINKFQSFDCIITDRLHGMLIAAISNVPCLAFDNSTHKVSGVWEWIKDYKHIEMVEERNIAFIMTNIKNVCNERQKGPEYRPLEKEFEKMADKIKNVINSHK